MRISDSSPGVRAQVTARYEAVFSDGTRVEGDKAFMTLAKLSGLKSLLLAGDAGISAAAVEKLKAKMPGLAVRTFERTPSILGEACHILMRNHYDKNVIVYWVNTEGQRAHPRTIKPNAQYHGNTRFGSRYEAYTDDKLVATFEVVVPKKGAHMIWEIKP